MPRTTSYRARPSDSAARSPSSDPIGPRLLPAGRIQRMKRTTEGEKDTNCYNGHMHMYQLALLNGEKMPAPLQATPGKHLGILFKFQLLSHPDYKTVDVEILEHVDVVEATGFFAGGVSVAQHQSCPMDDKLFGYDFIGQSSDEILEASNIITSTSGGESSGSGHAGSSNNGTYLARQYFSVKVGERDLVVKWSGDELRRTLKDGILTIQRVPAKVGLAEPGMCEGSAGELRTFTMQ